MRSVHEESPPAVPSAKASMNQSQRTFLAGVREELLEPVNAIVMFSDMLLTEAADRGQEAFADDLRKIYSSGKRLREMVDEFLGPEALLRTAAEEGGLATLQKIARHDMRNALNAIINYSEMCLEDSEETFLEGFRPDLERIHRHGKLCLAVLDKIVTARPQDLLSAASEMGPAGAPDPLFELEPGLERVAAAVEPGCCLVVDDNATNRDILCRLLLRQGHRVATAVNGRQAVEMVHAESFDLVLLDIQMPEMNGFQVLAHLKSDEKLRELPVIMISALDQEDSVIRCIALGAEDYLPKPFNPLLLRARIGACLEKKRFRDKEQNYLRQIEQEKKRADELLHVILPGPIVQELKATNEVKPRRYENVAVLFADLVGFTRYCEKRSPEEVVPYLQKLVEAWENSAVKHGVEKIKTIGDAFMAASGLLTPVDNPVLSCVRCGLDMIAATRSLPIHDAHWDLRVGIHIGNVMAGVIGSRQYLFDLWGATVNTAARMESHGKAGHITLSPTAWARIEGLARTEPLLEVEPREGVDVKSLGKTTLYDIASPVPQRGEGEP
jgi:adenylate cyclase